MNKPALFLATVTFVALLVLVGCAGPTGPSGSDGSASDPGDGASNTTEYGFNLVNTGSGDFQVSYVYSFCRDGESANDCITRGFGTGIRTAPPGGNAVGGIDPPGDNDVNYYLEWTVNSGSGDIEFAIVNETDSGAFVDEVLDSITVTGGSGTNFFALE